MSPHGGDTSDQLFFLRDLASCEPPKELYKEYAAKDIYKEVPKPNWSGLDDEIWTPRKQKSQDQELTKLMGQMSKKGSMFGGGDTRSSLGAAKFATKMKRKTDNNPKVKMRKILDGNTFQTVMFVLTIWALFADDVRVASMPKEADIPVAAVSLFVMIVFFMELGLRSWSQRSYLNTFFFWLDLVACASLITDVLPLFTSNEQAAGDSLSLARAGRAARVGTRVGRLLRLFRVIRVVKLITMVGKKSMHNKEEEEAKKNQQQQNGQRDFPPSELGKRLNELISQKVIMGVLALLFLLPVVEVSTVDFSRSGGMKLLQESRDDALKNVALLNQEVFSSNFEQFKSFHTNLLYMYMENQRLPTKHLKSVIVENLVKADDYSGCKLSALQLCPPDIAKLRLKEIDIVAFDDSDDEAWFNIKEDQKWLAYYGVITTLFIAALLGIGGFLLSRDCTNLVIRPIESMVDSVTKLSENPAMHMEAVEKVQYETDALKMSLNKIAGLLQVGFGEAGNDLVAENLRKGDTMNPMVPGKKLLGAYGFCIIDEYEEVLDCIGEEILPFTNTAADIVHQAVKHNGGQPNRNLGEAFLCVWKPQVDMPDPSEAEVRAAETKMCDGALTAFRRCVREIATSGKLAVYAKHEAIVKEFGAGKYKTCIGYGLHYGWAIEGAVGTSIKIDCSYLSPNVNLAARLESATKMYGVNILMSEYFVSKLSPSVKSGLRRVDVVCLKGSSQPMAIYTCDRSNGLYFSKAVIAKHGAEGVYEQFGKVYDEGMTFFVQGDWPAAKVNFEQALEFLPDDKPSKRMLMHMDTPDHHPDYGLAATPFEAPPGWPGYHILLSK